MTTMEQLSQSHKKKKKRQSVFEFCKVCNLNHDQGQSHKYFPNHKKSLSTFLSRYESKLSDVHFFLKNPTSLRPEHASRNRLWCVFCDTDIDEIGSSFACANAIKHLASVDHLKNLKHFLWRNGGGMDRVDSFRILEAEVEKWEKKYKSESEAVQASEGSQRPVFGPSNDIHTQINYGNNDSFTNNSIYSVESRFSNGVLPLQYHTNEYQVSQSGSSEVSFLQDATYSLSSATCYGTYRENLRDLTVNQNRQQHHLYKTGVYSAGGLSKEGVYQNGRMVKGESSSEALQKKLTRISTTSLEEPIGNVHSGAPPPWFDATEESQKKVLGSIVSHLNKSGKSKNLNPKRVGAAWAEKRKIELEMEKRGEIVDGNCDANWLPNFGRVWQSGSRKESRKEFEMEKQKLLKVESQPEMHVEIQPYISKRMRRGEVNAFQGTDHVVE